VPLLLLRYAPAFLNHAEVASPLLFLVWCIRCFDLLCSDTNALTRK
jgi:hypothetical protein